MGNWYMWNGAWRMVLDHSAGLHVPVPCMIFAGRKKGAMMGCTSMNHGDRAETGRQAGEPVEDTARRRYAAREIDRKEFQRIIGDLAK